MFGDQLAVGHMSEEMLSSPVTRKMQLKPQDIILQHPIGKTKRQTINCIIPGVAIHTDYPSFTS